MNKQQRLTHRFFYLSVALLAGLLLALVWHSRTLYAADPVTLTIETPPTILVGEPFIATVKLTDPTFQEIDGVGVYLNFDPAMLAVQNVTNVSPLDVSLIGPEYDNSAGTVDMVQGTLGERPNLPMDFMAITFVPLQAGESTIAFGTVFPRETQVTAFGELVPANAVPATIIANMPVEDTTPPVITLLGANPLEIERGDAFVDPGATATDDVDGDLTSEIVVGGEVVDTSEVGEYNVTYDVQDAAGNKAVQKVRVVRVVDTTPPLITLLGDNPLVLEVGTPYVDPGATASDNVDGNLSGEIVVGGDVVDTSEVGEYSVTYDVQDAAGNDAAQKVRVVRVVDNTPPPVEDTTPPVITLLGDNPLAIETGDPFVDPGATATDNVDGDLTDEIEVIGADFDTDEEGTYTVRYRVTDAAGNTSEVTRTVDVVTPPPPTSEQRYYLPLVSGG